MGGIVIEPGQTYQIGDIGHVFRAMLNSKGQIILVDMNHAPMATNAAELKKLPYVEFYLLDQEGRLTEYAYDQSNGTFRQDSKWTREDVQPCEYVVKTIFLNE